MVILPMVFFVFGTNHEHGDSNAGGMYPIAFAVPGIAITVFSYILYCITDVITYGKKINPIKNFAHLILGLGLLFFHDEAAQAIIYLSLLTILAINLSFSLVKLVS